jgi:hypothetical protein
MLSKYQPAQRTVYTFVQARDCLSWALQEAKKQAPTLNAMAVFLAKLRLESGNFQFCYNHNPGNIKHSSDANAPGDLTLYPCNEVLTRNGKPTLVWFSKVSELTGKNGTPVGQVYDEPPGHPQSRFVSNANRWAGFDHYVQFLLRPNYQAAFAAAWSGDPAKFSHVLKVSNYYTADETQYTNTLVKLFNENRAKLQGMPHEAVQLPGDGSYADWLEWQHLRAEIIGKSWERTQEFNEEERRRAMRELSKGDE